MWVDSSENGRIIVTSSETRERILFALNQLIKENEQRTQNRRGMLASVVTGARRKAFKEAITIVENTEWPKNN